MLEFAVASGREGVEPSRAGVWRAGAGDARVRGGPSRDFAGLSRELPTPREGEGGLVEGGGAGGVAGRAIRLETAGECGGKVPFRSEPDGDAGRGKADVIRETWGERGASSILDVFEGPGMRRKRSSTCV